MIIKLSNKYMFTKENNMKIAICDDNVLFGGEVEALIEKTFKGTEVEYDCECFLSGDKLLEVLKSDPFAFQIYLLDIEMVGTNGLEVAKMIREYDLDSVIIFMTSHGELMPEAFKVFAFEYIIKPLDEEKTMGTLLAAIQHIQKRKKVFQYTIKKSTHTLFLNQIEFLESVGRKIVIHTIDNQSTEYYGTLKDAAEKVKSLSFVQTNKSFIINMDHIKSIESNLVVMRNGNSVPIGRKYHTSFHSSYRKYIFSKR